MDISGGGFSNIFPQPDFQKVSVPAFLKSLGNKNKGLYKFVFFLPRPDPAPILIMYILSFFVCAAVVAAESPTSPLKQSITELFSKKSHMP